MLASASLILATLISLSPPVTRPEREVEASFETHSEMIRSGQRDELADACYHQTMVAILRELRKKNPDRLWLNIYLQMARSANELMTSGSSSR